MAPKSLEKECRKKPWEIFLTICVQKKKRLVPDYCSEEELQNINTKN
jgi:hypothetical protein